MLHLFNNVFLDHHTRISVPRGSKIMVFSDLGNGIDDNPNCLHNAETLDSFLGDNTVEDFFQDTFALQDKIYIYANEKDFAKIITCWLRSTTNMTRAEFEIWLGIYKFACKARAKHYDLLFTAIHAAWDEAPVYDFSSSNFDPSYEFLIASAFHNSNFSKKAKLIEILTGFVQKEYESFVLDVKRNIDSLILDSDLQTMLGANEYITNVDLDSLATQFPELAVFRESFWQDTVNIQPQLAYQSGSFDAGLSKIDLSKASAEELTEVLDFTETYTNRLAGGMDAAEQVSSELLGKIFGPRGFKYKDCILTNTLSDDHYNDILQEILDERLGLVMLPQEDIDTVLVQLLPYFRSLKNNNDLETLQKFTLK